MDAEEFRAALRLESAPYRRVQAFVAMLGEESGLGVEGLTVVGGSALEIYTRGDYVSDHIDLVASDRRRVEQVPRSWGFRQEGMYWGHPDLKPLVQIVGRNDSGSRQRNQIVSTRYGRVRVGSIEDIVWKRVVEARYWRRSEALDEAMLAARRYGSRIDWEHIGFQAKKNGVDDLIPDLRRQAGLDLGLDRPQKETRKRLLRE